MAKVTSIVDSPTSPAPLEQLSMAAASQSPQDTYFDFKYAQLRFNKIVEEWAIIRKETERYRLLRYIKTDKATLQRLNLFKEDETYIAVRLIDQNIRAEQPQRLAYITQPRRSVVLKPLYGAEVNGLENVETVFTDCARYVGWEVPFIKIDDGASEHGWDFVEVVFDPSKPGHFGVEHVGHDNLMFDIEAEDINNQEILGRRIRVTASQLKKYVREFEFNPKVLNEIIESDGKNEGKSKDVLYDVEKFFFRQDDIVYVCWYGGAKTTDFLCAPIPLYLGINELSSPPDQQGKYPRTAETAFPFFELDYIETESPKIVDKKGRGFLDEPAQEGSSAILSGIVNTVMRSSNVYGCVKQGPVPSADNAAPKQTEIKIKHGAIYDKEITFFSTPGLSESTIQALEITTQYNRLDVSRPDYAVKNRKDSRKTATEIAASVNDTAQQASVQSTQQSIFMRRVYSKCYEIFQNRCLQGDIKLDPTILELLKVPVDIKAAGDVDVIQRQEKLQRQMQMWPVISQTPIALPFLQDILVNMFPEEAPKYIQLLGQEQQGKQLVMGLATALKAAITDHEGIIKPEFKQHTPQLEQLAGQVQQYLQPSAQGASPNGQQPQQKIAA